MRWLRILALAALALTVLALGAWWFVRDWAPPRDRYAVQGIDISDADGSIDWSMVKARDVDFIYARATAGADRRDARFPDYWTGAASVGIRRGAVHIFSLCAPAADQAGAFVAVVPRDADALPAAIDLDLHDDCPARPAQGIVLDELRRTASIIEIHSGKPVVLRVSRAFETAYGVSGSIPRPIWAIRDFVEPAYLTRPWRMWRSSRFRRIDGIDGAVNWNVVAP